MSGSEESTEAHQPSPPQSILPQAPPPQVHRLFAIPVAQPQQVHIPLALPLGSPRQVNRPFAIPAAPPRQVHVRSALPLGSPRQVNIPYAILAAPPQQVEQVQPTQQNQQESPDNTPPRNFVLPPHHQQRMAMMWQNQLRNIQESENVRNNQLPVARIRKIMKLDESVNMISSEVPMLFSKACELFICDITTRSWLHTEDNNRRILQRSDIHTSIIRTDVFDFLVDLVPGNRDIETNDYHSAWNNNDNNNIYGDDGGSINVGGQNEPIESNNSSDNSTVPYAAIGITDVNDGVTIAAYPDNYVAHRHDGVTVAYPGTDRTDGNNDDVMIDNLGIDSENVNDGVTIANPGIDNANVNDGDTYAYQANGFTNANAGFGGIVTVEERMYWYYLYVLSRQYVSAYERYLSETNGVDPGEDDDRHD